MPMIIQCHEESRSRNHWGSRFVDYEKEDHKETLTRKREALLPTPQRILSKKNPQNLGIILRSIDNITILKINWYFWLDINLHLQSFYSFLSRDDDGESRPVERAIEARTGSEDGQGSMVRCLHFAHTYIANRKNKILIKTLISKN